MEYLLPLAPPCLRQPPIADVQAQLRHQRYGEPSAFDRWLSTGVEST